MLKKEVNFLKESFKRHSDNGIVHTVLSVLVKVMYLKDHNINYRNSIISLSKYRSNLNGTCYTNRSYPDQKKYDLDIIVPVYNVEKYLDNCINSILKQKTKYNFRVILVEDGSTDNSKQIIEQYRSQKNVLIIEQINQGLSAARDTGLNYVDANYIMFVDSDDLLFPGAVNTLLEKAYYANADIAEGSYVTFIDNKVNNKCISQNYKGHFKLGKLNGYAWGKIIKSNFFEHLSFPKGYLFEDTIFIFILYQLVGKIITTNKFIYKYRINPRGINISSKGQVERLDSFWITLKILGELPKFDIKRNDYLYEILLQQIVINFKRAFRIKPLKIQRMMFNVICEEIQKNWSNMFVNEKYRLLDKSIRGENFIDYAIFCLTF